MKKCYYWHLDEIIGIIQPVLTAEEDLITLAEACAILDLVTTYVISESSCWLHWLSGCTMGTRTGWQKEGLPILLQVRIEMCQRYWNDIKRSPPLRLS